jgi:transposase InsO family protein
VQYQTSQRDDEALRLALIRLAKQYGRYGYHKITELLRIEGWAVNHKKVERLWREEGLQLLQSHKRRRRLYQKDSSIIQLRPTHANHVWAIGFVHDKLNNGRSFKMLTVLDEYTRQALALTVCNRMSTDDVLEALYPLLLRHGAPEYIGSDNGDWHTDKVAVSDPGFAQTVRQKVRADRAASTVQHLACRLMHHWHRKGKW